MFPKGFKALGGRAGLYKDKKKKDIAVFYSDLPGRAAAVFTTSKLKSASIILSRNHLKNGWVQAVFANSGCANTCTGKKGYENILALAKETAKGLRISYKKVVAASTGVIGTSLPVKKMLPVVRKMTGDIYYHNRSFPNSAAEAIMTTDTHVKISQRSFKIGNRRVNIWGCAKGSGMIHPNMATMLAFILTDVSLPPGLLKSSLKNAVDTSFNSITVDGETSPNDTVFLFSNNGSGVSITEQYSHSYPAFRRHLNEVCYELSEKLVEDGEGARKLIRINVLKAKSFDDAKKLASLVATSPLFKTAMAGSDANWGRIMAVAGRSGINFNPVKTDIYFNGTQVVKNGSGISKSVAKAGKSLENKNNIIEIVLNTGSASASYLTCDYTEMYVRINASYLT